MFIILALAIGLLGGTLQHVSAAPAHSANPKVKSATTSSNPFCSRIGTSVGASSGAWMACKGAQPNSPSAAPTGNPSFGSNVDAANPREDITPSGVRVYGQSEVSIAGVSSYTVEAWNDATGFFAPCPSPMYKEELTGYGFSADGGKSFKDMGGLPNNCASGFKLFGDPSVETWQPGGTAYFYVSSLYFNPGTGQSDLAINACKVTGTGSSASLVCGMPIIAATGGPGDFLDKEFLTIDPFRGRLYMSYTRFGTPPAPTANGQIELAVCDIGTSAGGTGTGGGTAATPVCFPGASPAPYLIVQPAQVCENEGAYPAVMLKSGDVYVAWEYNWATNFFGPAPCNTTEKTQNVVAYVPNSCLTLTPVSPCGTTPAQVRVNIVSIDLAFIPGYNRNPTGSPANDFPRIAVAGQSSTVTIVWNDTRFHPMGDILLQSYQLVVLTPVQSRPVRINPDATGGLHFLPALRQSDDEGLLNVSYYQRNDGDTTHTNVNLVMNINPRTTGPGSATVVTTSPSNWLAVSSDIIPNFGDYTDNYVKATQNAPNVSDTLYVAWSDGRLGDPQPFEAHGFS
ncbi:MAG: hypothetical protein NVSMB27_13650 [Ktedonobacteraceae bacterium]